MESTPLTITKNNTLEEPSTSPLLQENVLVPASHLKRNIYPAVRHILLVVTLAFALSVIVFLIYQNGKSIYDHGL